MSNQVLTQDTVIGVFADRDQANRTIEALQDKGYSPKDLSVIMQDDNHKADDAVSHTGDNMAEGAASGALTGGALGALGGLLVGVGALAIPGIGGLLIGGPLAAALGLTGAVATTASGALTGALAGGLIGGLVGLGVPEDEARVYEERVKEGAIILAVPALLNSEDMDVKNTMVEYGAEQVRLLEA